MEGQVASRRSSIAVFELESGSIPIEDEVTVSLTGSQATQDPGSHLRCRPVGVSAFWGSWEVSSRKGARVPSDVSVARGVSQGAQRIKLSSDRGRSGEGPISC